jgi:hypothetical protein
MNDTIDVLMCVGKQDVEGLFYESLISCLQNFSLLGAIYIVSPCKERIRQKISPLLKSYPIHLLEDCEVLDPSLHAEDGWYRQQLIKLSAHKICKTRFVVCMGSDTILLQSIFSEDLFSQSGTPYQYFRYYEGSSNHYEYEKIRLGHIEKILNKPLMKSASHVDFILDFTMWDTKILWQLQTYLDQSYGPDTYKKLSPGRCDSLEKKTLFGEWTLYAAFALDVLQLPLLVKAFDETYFFQVHSKKDLERFDYRSKIVHFVPKNLTLSQIRSELQKQLKKILI